jgi:hypothetical protein
MAKRYVAVLALALMLVPGCGSAPSGSINARIVSNNSASFEAEVRKAMAFGELDVEALIRVAGKYIPKRPQTRTPDRPTAPQPIRPRPQADELDAVTGQTSEYLEKVEDVVAFYPELSDQGTFLAATPKARVDAIHASFEAELKGLGKAAISEKEKAWRKAGAETRLRLVVAKLADVTDLGPSE